MTEASFTVDDSGIVSVRGEVDMSNARDLAKVLAECDGPKLVIDCSGLEFIDSSGLNVIAVAYRRLSEDGGTVRLVGVRPNTARTVELMGFAEWLGP